MRSSVLGHTMFDIGHSCAALESAIECIVWSLEKQPGLKTLGEFSSSMYREHGKLWNGVSSSKVQVSVKNRKPRAEPSSKGWCGVGESAEGVRNLQRHRETR